MMPTPQTQFKHRRPLEVWLCVTVLLFYSTAGVFPGPGVNADSTVGIAFQSCFLLLMAALIASRFGAVMRLTGQSWLVLSLPALAACSATWSQAPSASFRRAVFLTVVTIFAHYMVVRFPVYALLDIVLLAGFADGAMSIAASLFVPSIGLDGYNGGAWQGIFGAKNNCAADMLLLVSPLLVCPQLRRPLPVWRLGLLLMAAVIIVKANSKMAFLISALCVATILSLRALRRFRSEEGALLRVVALLASCGLLYLFASVLPALLGSLGKDTSFGARTPIWTAVIEAIRMRPLLGFGYEAFWNDAWGQVLLTNRAIGFHISNAQNGFLDILLELGLVGLALTCVLFARAIRDLLRVPARLGGSWRDWTLLVLLITLVYQTDESFLLHPYSVPWFLTSITFALLHTSARGQQNATRRVIPFPSVPAPGWSMALGPLTENAERGRQLG